MKKWFSYAAGRASAIAMRPICLFVANNYLSHRTAEHLAIVMLASSLAVVGVAADPHRRYYAHHFGERAINGITFYLYAISLLIMIAVGSLVAFGIGFYSTQSLLIAVAAVAYFVSERFADEFQRYRIFGRDLDMWGRMAVQRALAQLCSVTVVFLFMRDAAPAWLIIFAMSAGNVLLFLPQLPPSFAKNLTRLNLKSLRWLIPKALRLLFASWPIWVAAQLTSGFGYLDRGAALVFDKSMLPLFMLVVMCFSIVQLTVDFYYFGRYRRDFLEQRISLRMAFTHPDFLLSFGSGLVLGAIACVVVLHSSRNGDSFPLLYVGVVCFLQTSVAIATIPREILYWAHRLATILWIEALFWGLLSSALLLAWLAALSLATTFVLMLACASVRLVHYMLAAKGIARTAQAVGKKAEI